MGQPHGIDMGPYTDSEGKLEAVRNALAGWGVAADEAEVSGSAKGQQSWVNSLIWVGIPAAPSRE